jgi:hypothetical protein
LRINRQSALGFNKLRINRQSALGFNKLRINRQSALGFYRPEPHPEQQATTVH